MNLFKKKALSIKGSALLLVLSLSLAIGIISTALYQSYLQIEILAIKKNNSIELDLALESLVQYTKKGVSSLWCFDKDYWQDELTTQTSGEETGTKRKCADLDEFLKHEGNVELLLADDNFKEKLRQLVAQKNAETESDDDNITTEVSSCLKASQCNDDEKWIEVSIDPANANDFPNENPIKPIIKKLASFSDEVKFKISLLGFKTHNLQGRRWIRISVSVLKSSKLIKELSVEYLMYPRQISSYAFLSANELRLNEEVRSLSSKKDGHTRISQINKSQISQYKGLDVFSPVYVNTNIVLPNKSTKFSPVHFKAPVILGKGILKRDGADGIKAFSSIDETKFEKKYYTSVDGMSGFSGGIEIRGKKDDGLEKLSDNSIEVNYDSIYQCVGKSEVSDTYSEKQIFVQTNNTYDDIENPIQGLSKPETRQRIRNHSKLMIKPLSQEQTSNELTLKYRLRLTPPNRFRSLPFSSKTGESISGINNPLKSILSLRLFSWKKNDFNNSKKEDKILLSWSDSFSYKKHEKEWFDTPDPDGGAAHALSTGYAQIPKLYLSKDDSIYTFLYPKNVWKSEDGLDWTELERKISEVVFDERKPLIVKRGNYFYSIRSPRFNSAIFRSADGINWESMSTAGLPPERTQPLFVVKEPYMYILGGGKPDVYGSSHLKNKKNEVWRSKDGLSWTQVYTPTADDTLELKSNRYIYTGENYSAVVKGDFIYAIGVKGPAKNCDSTDYANVWRYSIKANQWEEIPNSSLSKRSGPRLFVKDNYIYAMTGICKEGGSTRVIKDGLWRSIDGRHWEQVDTGNKVAGDEIPFVKEDGSVDFFKDGKSKFLSPASTLLKIKTSPVAEEGFEDSYKNNEIDLSISIKTNKVKNNPSNVHRFSFRAASIGSEASGYVGYSSKDMGGYKKGDDITSGSPPTGFFLLRTPVEGDNSPYTHHIFYIASQSFANKIKTIKFRKKADNGTWEAWSPAYNFDGATIKGPWPTNSDDQYWAGVPYPSEGHDFEPGKEYEVEIVEKQTEAQKGSSSITKNTKFVLDFLPYTLGSIGQATKTEEQYWSSQHKDFGASTIGISSRQNSLGKDDNDPSVFSALFKFDPRDFGTDTDTYDLPDKASEPDTFIFTAALIGADNQSNRSSYVGFATKVLDSDYNKEGGAPPISGSIPSGLHMIRTGYEDNIYYFASKSLSGQILAINIREKKSDGTFGSWASYIFHDKQATDWAENDEWKGAPVTNKFKPGTDYEVQVITMDTIGEIEKPATGSLYHDKGVNLNTCTQRALGKGDPKNDNNYIYKSTDQLASVGSTITDLSYTDWMTIGKSYFTSPVIMRLCAYKSTEEDKNGIQTVPCDEKAENKPNPFDALWEEDFLDYTKKSWNFFCSEANGDNTQIRRLSEDREVCTVGSPDTFSFRPALTTQSTYTESNNKHTTLMGFSTENMGSKYKAGAGSITGNRPSGLYLIRSGHENKIYYIASQSLSGNIDKINIREKDGTWEEYDFPEGDGTRWENIYYYKGLPDRGLKFDPTKEYEVQIIKKNESTLSPRSLSEKEYCAYCKPKETLCIGSGSNCNFTISNNLVTKKTSNSVPRFQNRGLYKKCVVNSSANFVVGFFVCEKFYVESRNTPLTIIGTVVSGKIDIHQQALKKGVSWMSIYHPKAVKLLQENGILYSSKFNLPGTNKSNIGFTDNCRDLFDFSKRNDSIWHPNNYRLYRSNIYTCSPSSLNSDSEAHPFNWTQVNPDCIQKRETEDSNSQILCKGRKRHFFMNEISRYSK